MPVFFDISLAADAPSFSDVEAEAARLRGKGVKEKDAEHLAVANLLWYIDIFVTDDKWLLKNKGNLGLRDDLLVCGAVEAEKTLNIAQGEGSPIRPHESSPLAKGPRWWVP
jgi:hypothetical protein